MVPPLSTCMESFVNVIGLTHWTDVIVNEAGQGASDSATAFNLDGLVFEHDRTVWTWMMLAKEPHTGDGATAFNMYGLFLNLIERSWV